MTRSRCSGTKVPYKDESTATLSAQFAELARTPGTTVRAVGDVEQALAGAARVVEAYYEFPFLSHATLEPHNCTADVRDGHCYITGPLQMQGSGAGVVAAAVGLPVDRVHIQVTRLGGGFGRRLLSDYAAEAAVVSKAIGGPVQVIGTREDDMRHDYYRPAGARRLRAGLDANGRIVAWDCHWSTSRGTRIGAGPRRRGARRPTAWSPASRTTLARTLELDLVPWHIPNVRLQFSEPRSGVATGAWRAPAHVSNAFAVETLLDEIAQLTRRNPVDLRLELYGNAGALRITGDDPTPYDPDRMAAVLRLAAERGGIGQAPPQGRARGLAAHYHVRLLLRAGRGAVRGSAGPRASERALDA